MYRQVCIFMYVFVCMHVCVCICTRACKYTCVYAHVCMYVSLLVPLYLLDNKHFWIEYMTSERVIYRWNEWIHLTFHYHSHGILYIKCANGTSISSNTGGYCKLHHLYTPVPLQCQCQCQNYKDIYRSCVKITSELHGHFRCPLFQKKNYIYSVPCYLADFKTSRELWSPLSKTVPGK